MYRLNTMVRQPAPLDNEGGSYSNNEEDYSEEKLNKEIPHLRSQ